MSLKNYFNNELNKMLASVEENKNLVLVKEFVQDVAKKLVRLFDYCNNVYDNETYVSDEFSFRLQQVICNEISYFNYTEALSLLTELNGKVDFIITPKNTLYVIKNAQEYLKSFLYDLFTFNFSNYFKNKGEINNEK